MYIMKKIVVALIALFLIMLLGIFTKSNLIGSKVYNNKIIKKETEEQEVNNIMNKKEILLVNKNKKLGSDYKPDNMANVNNNNKQKIYMVKVAADNFEKMVDEAKKDRINIVPVSAYRFYKYQEDVFNQSIRDTGFENTKKYVATPGESEHQTGLAIDVGTLGAMDLTESFEKTDAYKWLINNMENYEFILRYPRRKEGITGYNYEPWHLRYVGVKFSKYIDKEKLTLEEYINK